jgi:hypothetical protein
MEALSEYYSAQRASLGIDSAAIIQAARRARRQTLAGGMSGFMVAAAVAILLLVWAARPTITKENATASAIARYQMMNSGLVEKTAQGPVAR